MPLHSEQLTPEQSITERSPNPSSKGVKRYNLVLPEELFNAVQELADQRQTTVVELIRRFIKLGLIAAKLEDTPGAALIIREGDSDQRIVLL